MANKLLPKSTLVLCLVLVLFSMLLVSAKADDDTKEENSIPIEAPPTMPNEEDIDDDDDDEMPEVPEGMRRENSVRWTAPNINDEEAHSTRLPSNLKCDGCTAVAYQLSTAFSDFHSKYEKKGTRAPESEVIEIAERICSRSTFENYGLKSMNGVNRISGPGTEAADEAGMMQGGGRWPYRLSMMCGEIVGEVDEYEIYQFVVDNGPEKLYQLLCENPADMDVLNSCGPGMVKDEL